MFFLFGQLVFLEETPREVKLDDNQISWESLDS